MIIFFWKKKEIRIIGTHTFKKKMFCKKFVYAVYVVQNTYLNIKYIFFIIRVQNCLRAYIFIKCMQFDDCEK